MGVPPMRPTGVPPVADVPVGEFRPCSAVYEGEDALATRGRGVRATRTQSPWGSPEYGLTPGQ